MDRARIALIWRGLFAVVGWASVGLYYGLTISGLTPAETATRTLHFFSFFTIQTNLLVAVALTLPVIGAGTGPGRWAASEGVRAGVTMYAVVVGLVYHFLLHATWNPQGLYQVANISLHYVMPVAILFDWLVFTPNGRLRWIDAGKWLAFPLIYSVWLLLLGAFSGWYPYWFIDVPELGLGRTLRNLFGLLAFFGIVGLIVVAIDRTLGRRDRTAASA
jgi:hypothetical protein